METVFMVGIIVQIKSCMKLVDIRKKEFFYAFWKYLKLLPHIFKMITVGRYNSWTWSLLSRVDLQTTSNVGDVFWREVFKVSKASL